MTPITLPDNSPKTPFEKWLAEQGWDRYPNFSRQQVEAAFNHQTIVASEERAECKTPSSQSSRSKK